MPVDLDEATRVFVEDFAYAWGQAGIPRMEGRILGLLLIVDAPMLSSARIAELLGASAGAVSMATRSLINVGFIRPHSVPGDRNRYFRVEDDVWGGFLASEREYFGKVSATIDYGLGLLEDTDGGPRTRLENARRYMTWLSGYHSRMLADWEAYRDGDETT